METVNNPNPAPAPPDNNLVWAILSTIFCCIPLGIVAIIKATKVKELWALGDYEGAQKASKDALKYSLWGAAITFVFVMLYILFVVILGVASAGF